MFGSWLLVVDCCLLFYFRCSVFLVCFVCCFICVVSRRLFGVCLFARLCYLLFVVCCLLCVGVCGVLLDVWLLMFDVDC